MSIPPPPLPCRLWRHSYSMWPAGGRAEIYRRTIGWGLEGGDARTRDVASKTRQGAKQGSTEALRLGFVQDTTPDWEPMKGAGL